MAPQLGLKAGNSWALWQNSGQFQAHALGFSSEA